MAALGTLALFFAVESSSEGADEPRMHFLINSTRNAQGHPRLDVTPFLRSYAEAQAHDMANAFRIFHDPCLGCSEVVGVTATNPWSIFEAWMRSDVHRRILMAHDAELLGCGVVDARGFHWWVCELRS
jgi:uncharacterized protein YkwD